MRQFNLNRINFKVLGALGVCLLSFWLFFLEKPLLAAEKGEADYTLGVGDRVEVMVWRNEDLSREAVIRPDGRLSLPLAGEIKAAGLTPEELSRETARKLGQFIKDPRVSIMVIGFGSQRILVLGEVERPGIYNLTKPLTALEAIAGADGYKEFAYLKSVMVIRKAYSVTPEILTADLLSVISRGDLSGDINLKPGDIVYVPKKFVGKIKDFLTFFNSNIKPIADSYINYRHVEAIKDLADSE